MPSKALSTNFYPILAQMIISLGGFDFEKIVQRLREEQKHIGNSEALHRHKVHVAAVRALAAKLCADDPNIALKDLHEKVNSLGVKVTRGALSWHVRDLQKNRLLTTQVPFIGGKSPETNGNAGEILFGAAQALFAVGLPESREVAHEWMKRQVRYVEPTPTELDDAIVRVCESLAVAKAIRIALDKGLGEEAFLKVASSNYPRWLVQMLYEHSSGKTKAPRIPGVHLPGIFRLDLQNADLDSILDVPESSYGNPLTLLPRRRGRLRIGVINGVHFGVAHANDIESNQLRKAFSYLKHTGADAVVIGGGLLLPDFKRASGSRSHTLESLLSGYKLDIEDFPPWYQPDVRASLEGGFKEPIYVTASQRLTSLMRGFYKVMVSPHGPEFPGPVYIILSEREQNLIAAVAFYELHYLHVKNVQEARSRLEIVKRLLQDPGTHEGYERYKEAVERMALTVKSNIDPTVERNVLDLARKAIIKLIERDSGIPNLRIIGNMDAHVRFGDAPEIIHFTSGAGGDSFVSTIREYGDVQKRGELPDLVHILDAAAPWYRETVRENFTEPKRATPNVGGRSSTLYVQSPMFIDEDIIERRLKGWKLPSRLHPILKARSAPGFNPGMAIISVGGNLPAREEFIETRLIRNLGPKQLVPPGPRDRRRQKGRRKRMVRVLTQEQYFAIALLTDIHMGNPNRYLMELPNGSLGGVTEAYLWLVRMGGLSATPHSAFFLDDLCHGNHFGTHKVIHENRLSAEALQKQVERYRQDWSEARSRQKREYIWRKVTTLMQEQRLRTGDHELTSQLRAFREFILFNFRDVHQRVIERYKKSGGKYRSVSEVLGNDNYYDYDIGPFSFGSGNHVGRTTDNMLNEGDVLADYLRALLFDPAQNGRAMDELRSLIKAYNYQQESVGFGRLAFPTFEYALELNSSPGRVHDWSDVLKGVVISERGHGDPVGILSSKYTVRFYGDKHFHVAHFTSHGAYVMGAPDTTTDSYSYKVGRLPPNNTGVTLVYLPVRGPMHAPIMTRFLDAYTLHRALQNKPEKFPWRDWHPVLV